LPSADILCGQGRWGNLQMRTSRTSALFGAKNFGFFKIYGVPAWTREGSVSQCGQGSSSDADVRTFWCKKNFAFFKVYGVSARTRGKVSSADKGDRVNFFAILCGRNCHYYFNDENKHVFAANHSANEQDNEVNNAGFNWTPSQQKLENGFG